MIVKLLRVSPNAKLPTKGTVGFELKKDNWCDGCNFVQPYWITYRESAEKTRKAKYKLTRKIKSLIKQGYKY